MAESISHSSAISIWRIFSTAALSNGGIMSPIVSYQYYEWPGSGILNLQSSPTVSYYYQFLDAPVLNIVSTTRTPTTAESTPAYLISPPPPSQLMAYHGGIFTANLASIDPNQMTVVLTHGWRDNPNTWALSMAILIHNNVTAPSLQAQLSGGNLMLSWPMSAQNFSLQTTTNLGDPNSWVTLTNVPAIVNLQNAVTNPITSGQGFYRLIQSQ